MRAAPLAAALFALTALAPSALAGTAQDADLAIFDGGLTQLTFVGLLQAQVAPLVGDDSFLQNGDPAEQPGFRLRRARFGVHGTAWAEVDYELTFQATPAGVDLLDAWMGWHMLSSLSIYGGARKVPYSRFALVGSGDGALSERPLAVRAMAPFRQVGVTLEGEVGGGIVGWAAGVYNGFSRNASFAQGYGETAALDGNRFSNLAYVGRVELAPLGSLGQGLPDLDHGGFRAGLGGGVYYDDGKTVTTFGYEIDLLVKVKGLHLAAELLADSSDPATQPTTGGAIPSSTSRLAVASELGYVICPAQLGVTARFELIDDNTDLDDNGDQLVLAGGVQYYFQRHHLQASLEYTHRSEINGASLDNDSLLLQLQLQL